MNLRPEPAVMSHDERLIKYGSVSTYLSLFSDQQIEQILNDASPVHSGIGGTALMLEVEGTPVFTKRIPLTDLERRSENVMSTANVFELPAHCHYGIISLGFGVWRELAAQAMASDWVLAQKSASFPLLYHWRVIQDQPRQTVTSELQEELRQMAKYWEDTPSVQARLQAIEQSTAYVALFLEFVPKNILDWLNAQLAAGDDAVSSACAMVERSLRTDVSFMNSNGLLHFDAHSKNILTDGLRLYFADFGLALSQRFELSADELDFAERNRLHDACHTVTQLANWIVTALAGFANFDQRNDFISRCAEGEAVNLEPSISAILKRYAPIAVIFNKFYRELFFGNKTALFPADELQLAWSKVAGADNDT